MVPLDGNPERLARRKPVIGLLGGVGAGKSSVAAEFARLGCAVIDGDRIGQELLETDEVKVLVRRQWGGSVFDAAGRVDRKTLAAIVFNRLAELDVLNKMMQPRIRQRMERLVEQAQLAPEIPAAVMDAAIMLEAGWDDLCTHLVFVDAPAECRKARVESRGWDGRAWEEREKSQISLDAKRKHCYAVIDNSLTASCLAEQVRELFNQLVHSA